MAMLEISKSDMGVKMFYTWVQNFSRFLITDVSHYFFQTQPFLFPVTAKEVPDYSRIVKKPMDLQRIREVVPSLLSFTVHG